MSNLIFNMPLLLAGMLIVGALCLYATVGLLLVRRLVLPKLRILPEDSEFTGSMMQAIMVFYGLAVALIAVNVWETHTEAAGTASLEASRLAGLHRDVSGYPEPLRSQLQDELESYTNYVIHEAWPTQQRGEVPSGGVVWMNRFQDTLESFEPRSEREKILHAEALGAYNRLIEARRLRLDAVLSHLSDLLWFVIVAGAFISLSSTFFFKVTDARLHALQVVMLAGFIGLVITLVLAFDRPFHGELAVDSGAYELVRGQLMDSSRGEDR